MSNWNSTSYIYIFSQFRYIILSVFLNILRPNKMKKREYKKKESQVIDCVNRSENQTICLCIKLSFDILDISSRVRLMFPCLIHESLEELEILFTLVRKQFDDTQTQRRSSLLKPYNYCRSKELNQISKAKQIRWRNWWRLS